MVNVVKRWVAASLAAVLLVLGAPFSPSLAPVQAQDVNQILGTLNSVQGNVNTATGLINLANQAKGGDINAAINLAGQVGNFAGINDQIPNVSPQVYSDLGRAGQTVSTASSGIQTTTNSINGLKRGDVYALSGLIQGATQLQSVVPMSSQDAAQFSQAVGMIQGGLGTYSSIQTAVNTAVPLAKKAATGDLSAVVSLAGQVEQIPGVAPALKAAGVDIGLVSGAAPALATAQDLLNGGQKLKARYERNGGGVKGALRTGLGLVAENPKLVTAAFPETAPVIGAITGAAATYEMTGSIDKSIGGAGLGLTQQYSAFMPEGVRNTLNYGFSVWTQEGWKAGLKAGAKQGLHEIHEGLNSIPVVGGLLSQGLSMLGLGDPGDALAGNKGDGEGEQEEGEGGGEGEGEGDGEGEGEGDGAGDASKPTAVILNTDVGEWELDGMMGRTQMEQGHGLPSDPTILSADQKQQASELLDGLQYDREKSFVSKFTTGVSLVGILIFLYGIVVLLAFFIDRTSMGGMQIMLPAVTLNRFRVHTGSKESRPDGGVGWIGILCMSAGFIIIGAFVFSGTAVDLLGYIFNGMLSLFQ